MNLLTTQGTNELNTRQDNEMGNILIIGNIYFIFQ